MNTYATLAIGVTAGLIAAPITYTAAAATPTDCATITDQARHVDGKLWRSAERHDGRPTHAAVTRWRVDTLYLESWARQAGC